MALTDAWCTTSQRTTYVDLALARAIDAVVLNLTSVDSDSTLYQGRSNVDRAVADKFLKFGKASPGNHRIPVSGPARAASLSTIRGGVGRELLTLWM